jgi:hypothetical protein
VSQGSNHDIERFLFPAQFLGARRIFPDCRVFDQSVDLIESILLGIEVKDTSEVPGCVGSDLQSGFRCR